MENDRSMFSLPNTPDLIGKPVERSTSLDQNYLNKLSDAYDGLKISSNNTSPASSYGTEDDIDDDSNARPITRSYTVGAKGASLIHSVNSWKFLENNHDTYPDLSQASKKSPLLGQHEIRIPNEFGTIYALAVGGSRIVIGTSQFGIQLHTIPQFLQPLQLDTSSQISLSSTPSLAFSSCTSLDSAQSSPEIIRSICFVPAIFPRDDLKVVWAGTETGTLMAYDLDSDEVLTRRTQCHSNPVNFILRNRHSEIWTLDMAGQLKIWSIANNSLPTAQTRSALFLAESPDFQSSTTPNAHSAILSSIGHLWMVAGKSVYRFDRSGPTLVSFEPSISNVVQLFLIPHYPNQIFGLSSDGQVASWDQDNFHPFPPMTIAKDRCTSVLCVGDFHLWIGFENGMMAVYDTRPDPWVAVKIWKAHRKAIVKLVCDPYAISTHVSVTSMDLTGDIAIWDGLLGNHWLEDQILTRTSDYCEFNDLNIMSCSWNIGAVKPDALSESDVEKLHEWIHGMEDPDIIMIGIQEILELTPSTLNALESLWPKTRKSDSTLKAEENLTHRYLLWYEYLKQIIEDNFGIGMYHLIKTDQLVGLFSCVFVKGPLECRIKHIESTIVKTGFRVMNKGLHGNKGGIAIRFLIDDSSFCFVNCHLASGQAHMESRNNDLRGIVYSSQFRLNNHTLCHDPVKLQVIFKRDADGSSILDHELCFLGGDLNYRIDLEREQVLQILTEADKASRFESWESLQMADQLKGQQASNPWFRVIGFKEAPLLFDPTYKYDAQGNYDKKRVPAWCDRVLYRVPNTTRNLYYKRHEVVASDHRPISAGFKITTKTIVSERLDMLKEAMQTEWHAITSTYFKRNKLKYVLFYDLCDESEATQRLETEEWDVDKVLSSLYRDKGMHCSAH